MSIAQHIQGCQTCDESHLNLARVSMYDKRDIFWASWPVLPNTPLETWCYAMHIWLAMTLIILLATLSVLFFIAFVAAPFFIGKYNNRLAILDLLVHEPPKSPFRTLAIQRTGNHGTTSTVPTHHTTCTFWRRRISITTSKSCCCNKKKESLPA
jgi:hypothetical protein